MRQKRINTLDTKNWYEEMTGYGAAKIIDDSNVRWVHYSRSENTLKLREFHNTTVEEKTYDLGGDSIEEEENVPVIEEWLSISELKKLLPDIKDVETFSVKEENGISTWQYILSKLNSDDLNTESKSSSKDHAEPTVIPITRLRRYYNSMREFEKALFQPLSEFYLKNPKYMRSLWNASQKQFKDYCNQENWSQFERKKVEAFTKKLTDVSSTTEFIGYLKNNKLGDTGFEYVDREISPWQTKNGVYSKSKKTGKTSGAGGIDVLLRSNEGVPVIGEVKIKQDYNTFFALIQAMTYAVELSTLNQLKRLKEFRTAFKDLDPANGAIEIAIILVNHDEKKDLTWDSAVKLISRLNKEKFCQGLSKITLLKNDNEEWNLYD